MKVCPVCHGRVDENDAAAHSRMVYYLGRFYYLMCPQCKAAFMPNPNRYADGSHGGPARVPTRCDGSEGTNDRPFEPNRAG